MMKQATERLRGAWPLVLLALATATLPAAAQEAQTGPALLATFEDAVTEFTLDNGMTFIVVERHDAPVVSFFTYADVGSVDEPVGLTGIAHMFEHMAFKGTTSLGSLDIASEVPAIEAEEAAFQALRQERAKGALADSARIAELQAAFESAGAAAKAYVEVAAFDNLLSRNGAVGMNAFTSADQTGYFYSLPANKLELWFATESDRFQNPVLREFYQERDVVMEERRMRTESNPIGRLIEEVLTTAFKAHPYGQPTVGHMSDLRNLSRTDAERFFERYYQAGNLTAAIVGDVDPAEVRRLAEQYFAPLPQGEDPMPITTEEPAQLGERRIVIEEESQPVLVAGYHRPSGQHPDAVVYGVIQDALSGGRTGRFYTELVEAERALQAAAIETFPGEKYETLFLLFALPNQGVDVLELEAEIYAILDDVKENGVTEAELERAKTRARAQLLSQLQSNQQTGILLAETHVLEGDWRALFRRLDAIEAVTNEDVMRVAQDTFQKRNRTVGLIRTADAAGADPTAAATE